MSSLPGSALLVAIRKAGGICPSWAEEITGERAHIANRRLPGLFRKGGMSGDDLREFMLEEGYLAEYDAVRADRSSTGGAIELALERIREAFAGEHVMTVWDSLEDRAAPPQPEEVFGLELEELERIALDPAEEFLQSPELAEETKPWRPLMLARRLRAEAKRQGKENGKSRMVSKAPRGTMAQSGAQDPETRLYPLYRNIRRRILPTE